MIHKIGEEIRVVRDYEIETILSENKLQVKEGDKGFIDSSVAFTILLVSER